jgi:hypothetical protein
MDFDYFANMAENHGLSLLLVGIAIVIIGIPAGKRLAELIGVGSAFFRQSTELVMALARGDGNGRQSIWVRIDGLEEQIDERFAEQGRLMCEVGQKLDAHLLEAQRPRRDCDERLRRIEELIGLVWPGGERRNG